MTEHEFTLVIDGDLTDEDVARELFEAGPDDIVTMAEIADRLERTRESVRLLITGKRGRGGFPAPISHSRDRGRLWRWSDVAEWLGALDPEEREAAHFVTAANAVFEFRYGVPLLNDDTAVKALFQLVNEAAAGTW